MFSFFRARRFSSSSSLRKKNGFEPKATCGAREAVPPSLKHFPLFCSARFAYILFCLSRQKSEFFCGNLYYCHSVILVLRNSYYLLMCFYYSRTFKILAARFSECRDKSYSKNFFNICLLQKLLRSRGHTQFSDKVSNGKGVAFALICVLLPVLCIALPVLTF
jgi:hypothetical protein